MFFYYGIVNGGETLLIFEVYVLLVSYFIKYVAYIFSFTVFYGEH